MPPSQHRVSANGGRKSSSHSGLDDVTTLHTTVNQLYGELDKRNAKLSETSQANSDLKLENRELKEQNRSLKDEAKRKSRDLKALRAEYDMLKEHCSALEAQRHDMIRASHSKIPHAPPPPSPIVSSVSSHATLPDRTRPSYKKEPRSSGKENSAKAEKERLKERFEDRTARYIEPWVPEPDQPRTLMAAPYASRGHQLMPAYDAQYSPVPMPSRLSRHTHPGYGNGNYQLHPVGH